MTALSSHYPVEVKSVWIALLLGQVFVGYAYSSRLALTEKSAAANARLFPRRAPALGGKNEDYRRNDDTKDPKEDVDRCCIRVS